MQTLCSCLTSVYLYQSFHTLLTCSLWCSASRAVSLLPSSFQHRLPGHWTDLQNGTFVPCLESLLSINCFLNPSPSGRKGEILAPLCQAGCTNRITCRKGALALLVLDEAVALAGPCLCVHPWGHNIEIFLYLLVNSHCFKPFMGFPATLLALACPLGSLKSLLIQQPKG